MYIFLVYISLKLQRFREKKMLQIIGSDDFKTIFDVDDDYIFYRFETDV